MDEELAALLASVHRTLGVLEGMTLYMPDKESIQQLLLLRESYYSKMINYPVVSFYDVLAGRLSANFDIGSDNNFSLAYKSSFGKTFTTSTLSTICSIASYGVEIEVEFEIRRKHTFLYNVATNVKSYNPTAPEHILPAITDISIFLARF